MRRYVYIYIEDIPFFLMKWGRYI